MRTSTQQEGGDADPEDDPDGAFGGQPESVGKVSRSLSFGMGMLSFAATITTGLPG